MSRALLNNAEVANFVKTNFVPVSAAVEVLQPQRYGSKESEQSNWFVPMAEQAMKKFGPPGFWKKFKTYQGMYVVGADGVAYEYKIGLPYDPKYFLNVLDKALNAYRNSPHRRIPVVAVSSKPSMAVDPAVSVVRVYSRIVPLPDNATISERSVGRDHMWIMQNEVQAILDGAHDELPRTLVARMVRFQLLNHVGNIMRPFDEKQVKLARFPLRKTGEKGNIVSFAFNGQYSSYAPPKADDGGEGAVDGTIAGEFDIDKATEHITRFRAYGEALSQGRNDSLVKTLRYPVCFAMIEANDKISRSAIPFWAAVPLIAPTYEKPQLALWSK